MKKTLFLLLIIIMFGCRNDNQISEQKFEKDLYNLFDIVVIKNTQGTKSIFYNFGMNIDSASVYYDLVKGFNNQYPLYLTRKPFIDVNLNNFLTEQDTISGTKRKIYEIGKSQQWFKFYQTLVAYYLKGKGITIEKYELPKLILITQEELMEIVSKFFYVYGFNGDSGLEAKLCGGINPFNREELIINPIIEAFAFQALVNLMVENTSLLNSFYNEYIPQLNKKIQKSNYEKSDAVEFAKNYTYHYYEKDSILQQRVISQYIKLREQLPFKITNLTKDEINND